MLTRPDFTRSRNFWIAAAAGFLLLGLGVYVRAIGNRYCVYGMDTISHDYIMQLYGWEQVLGNGRLPLWCPYIFLGLPFVGSFAFCPFYPTQLLYFVLWHNTAFTLQYALALAAGGFCFALWMRQSGMPRTVAVWAGAAFMLSGHFLSLTYAGHLQKMMAIAWAPLAFAGLERIRRQTAGGISRGDWRRLFFSVCMFAAALAMQMLASHAQIFYATLWVIFAYAVTVAAMQWRKTHRAIATWPVPVAAAAGVILALCISAVQTCPGIETSSVSNRAAGVTYQEAVISSYPPEELPEYVVPSMFGDSVRGSKPGYFGRWNAPAERIVTDYVGMPLFLLAVLGVAASPRRLRLFLAGVLLASLLVALGRYTFIYRVCYALLPGFSSFRSPGTFMFLSTMALIGLAALGFTELAKPFPRRFRLALTLLNAAAVIVITLSVCQNWGTSQEIATQDEAHRIHMYNRLLTWGTETLLICSLLLMIHRRPKALRGLSIEHMAAGAGALAVAAMLVHNSRYVQFEPLSGYMHYLTKQQSVYPAVLQQGDRPVRLVEERSLKTDNILHGVGSATGYHPVMLRRFSGLVETLGYASARFTSLFHILFAHTYSSAPPEGPWSLLVRLGQREYLWQRDAATAPYLATEALVAEVPEAEQMSTPTLEQHLLAVDRVAVIGDRTLFAAKCRGGKQETHAELISWSPHIIALKAASEDRSLLPMAEVFAPGWKAFTEEGLRLPIVPVNLAQRAVVLPGGTHRIVVQYDPFSYRFGLFVSLLSGMFILSVILKPRADQWIRARMAQQFSDAAGVSPPEPAGPPAQEIKPRPEETPGKPQEQPVRVATRPDAARDVTRCNEARRNEDRPDATTPDATRPDASRTDEARCNEDRRDATDRNEPRPDEECDSNWEV